MIITVHRATPLPPPVTSATIILNWAEIGDILNALDGWPATVYRPLALSILQANLVAAIKEGAPA